MAKRSNERIHMNQSNYTPMQAQNIRRTLDKAHSNSRKDSVGRATASLAKKYDRSPAAIERKYGRMALGWLQK